MTKEKLLARLTKRYESIRADAFSVKERCNILQVQTGGKPIRVIIFLDPIVYPTTDRRITRLDIDSNCLSSYNEQDYLEICDAMDTVAVRRKQ